MLMVISPAKTLDYESPLATSKASQPDFLDDACELVDRLKTLEPHDISNLMGVSDKLGQLNAERFRSWQTPFTQDNARQAVLAFKGDVYTGLDAESFSDKEFGIAQKRLRILSGLYGVLKPLDLMQPYRLEMGTKFENNRGKDLYAFWGNSITEELNRLLKADDGVLVNLASNEYFRSVRKKELDARLITPQFKDWKNGQYKMISFYAKKARGLMCRYAIQNDITQADDLKGFDLEGYRFSDGQSDADNWVFLREAS
jgi:cytoplasmic iron level regulating protein YaaA (DUF328/UPF0246 family)